MKPNSMVRNAFWKIWLWAAVIAGSGIMNLSFAHDRSEGRDHERVCEALQAGKVLPLRAVLEIVERTYPGKLVKIEFESDDDLFFYKIKFMQDNGSIVKLKIDARDGSTLGMKGGNVQFNKEP